MSTTEKDLIQACLQNHPASQRALYEQYKVPMFRVCLRYAGSRTEAEDMLQDGFVQVFRDLRQYSGKGPFGGWVRRIMVNTALQALRKKKMRFVDNELDPLLELPSAEPDALARLNAEALTKLIQQLPDGYRTVFNLYVVEGYTHKEIGEQLGIDANTSKSQLSKAKAKLRTILEKIMIT